MQPLQPKRRHLERQITYAGPILLVLALVDLLEQPPAGRGPHRAVRHSLFMCFIGSAVIQNLQWIGETRLPLSFDLALSPHSAADAFGCCFLFLYLFVALAVGIRWRMRSSVILAGVVTFALLVRTACTALFALENVLSWIALLQGRLGQG